MKKIQVWHFDAFTKIPNKGNPAGVVIIEDALSETERQLIAKKVGFNETVFVERSVDADYRFQYFTPGHEINLCGHATVAGTYALHHFGNLTNISKIAIKTNVGVLNVSIIQQGNDWLLDMEQDTPKFVPFEGDLRRLAEVLTIDPETIVSDQIRYGSTGTWTLLVPVKHVKNLEEMIPHTQRFPEVLEQMPKVSIHPYTLEQFEATNVVVARHFSSPYSGTIEDPVTGTASGVIAADLLNQYQKQQIEFDVIQGREMRREGSLKAFASLENRNVKVKIQGACVYNKEMPVFI